MSFLVIVRSSFQSKKDLSALSITVKSKRWNDKNQTSLHLTRTSYWTVRPRIKWKYQAYILSRALNPGMGPSKHRALFDCTVGTPVKSPAWPALSFHARLFLPGLHPKLIKSLVAPSRLWLRLADWLLASSGRNTRLNGNLEISEWPQTHNCLGYS